MQENNYNDMIKHWLQHGLLLICRHLNMVSDALHEKQPLLKEGMSRDSACSKSLFTSLL